MYSPGVTCPIGLANIGVKRLDFSFIIISDCVLASTKVYQVGLLFYRKIAFGGGAVSGGIDVAADQAANQVPPCKVTLPVLQAGEDPQKRSAAGLFKSFKFSKAFMSKCWKDLVACSVGDGKS